MTCVVGLITHTGDILFGADSLVTTDGGNKITLVDKKVFIKNNLIIGWCGDLRFGQLIKHRFNPPSPGRSKDTEAYIHTKFIPELQKFFIDAGVVKVDAGSFEILVGLNKTIFLIDGDFSVVEAPARYHAIGSGGDYALGAMYATKGIVNDTQRITVALDAASSNSQTVAKPYNFERLVAPTKPQKKLEPKKKR